MELRDTYIKRAVVLNYYKNVASLLERLDKDTLNEDYEYLEFKCSLKDKEDKVCGIISGNLPIEFILEYEDFDELDVEDNIEDLFIPKFLREE